MPLPTRHEHETKEAFIERCMGDPVMNREFPDNRQRYAVCQRLAIRSPRPAHESKAKSTTAQSGLVAMLLALALASGASAAEWRVVTGYCGCRACCGDWSDIGRTASGHLPRAGITVAGPRTWPFGTRIWIEGLGVRVVQDRTARAYEGRVDVYFRTHDEARRFGRKSLRVVRL